MSAIDQTLATIRERIGQHSGRGISEEATKTALVNPLLRALGWDTEDLHQVYPEYSSVGGRVDYALLINDEPRLLIEAKALEANLDDLKWVTQLTTYAVTTGVSWTVLTNGDEYRIYNAYAQVSLAEKLFHTVQLSDREPQAVEFLNLLSRSAVLDNRLDSHWQVEVENRRQQRVNQQLQKTLQALVDQDPPNESLVRLMRNQPNCELAPADIREGLRRTQVRVELPSDSETPPDISRPPDNPVNPGPPEPRRRGRVKLEHLIEADILRPPLEIHTTYRRQRLTARIEADGAIVFHGNRYPGPSAAGSAVKALHGELSSSGISWDFWNFIDTDGRSKPLGVLRQRFVDGREANPLALRPFARPRSSRVSLGHLINAEVFKPPLEIHTTYKGPRLTARIEADGAIVFQGNRYATPSRAGQAAKVLRGGPNVGPNGWSFWHFIDADGRNLPLSVLRDRYLAQHAPE
ncbi:MAG: type I restriction endonuclease [Chloroflexi bacterium]|nr:type I restriction endonuclease [Chloroflexota bacterium]